MLGLAVVKYLCVIIYLTNLIEGENETLDEGDKFIQSDWKVIMTRQLENLKDDDNPDDDESLISRLFAKAENVAYQFGSWLIILVISVGVVVALCICGGCLFACIWLIRKVTKKVDEQIERIELQEPLTGATI